MASPVSEPPPATAVVAAPSPPLPLEVPASDDDAALRAARASQLLELLFNLKRQRLVSDFSCALSDGAVPTHGRLYVTEDCACFFSNLFGRDVKRILPFRSCIAIERKAAAFLFPAVEFRMRARTGGEKRVLFTSFFGSYREECVTVCTEMLTRHRAAHGDAAAAWLTSPSNGNAAAMAAAAYEGGDVAGAAVGGELPGPAPTGDAPEGATADGDVAGAGAVVPLVRQPSPRGGDAGSAVPKRKRSDSLPSGVGRTSSSLSELERLGDDSGGGGSGGEAGIGVLSPLAATAAATVRHGGLDVPSPSPLGGRRRTLGVVKAASTSMPASSSLTRAEGGEPSPSAAAAAARGRGHTEGANVVSDRSGSRMAAHSAGTVPAGAPAGGASSSVPAPVPAEAALPPLPPSLWPRLSKTRILVDAVLPVSVARFFDLCVRDGAPFSVGEMHAKQKAFDVAMGAWAETGEVTASGAGGGGGSAASGSGTATGAGSVSVTTGPTEPLVTRTLRYTMPLDPMPLTPSKTRVEKVQKLGKYAAGTGLALVVETSARSLDVPFGDYFVTEDIWVVVPVDLPTPLDNAPRTAKAEAVEKAATWHAAHGTTTPPPPMCRIIVGMIIQFSKWTVLKGQIISWAEKAAQAFYDANMALLMREIEARLTDGSATAAVPPSTEAGDDGGAVAAAADAPHPAAAAPTEPAAGGEIAPRSASNSALATVLSPANAATAGIVDLRRAYNQLYAAHASTVAQLRQLQARLDVRDGGASDASPAAAAAAAAGTVDGGGGSGILSRLAKVRLLGMDGGQLLGVVLLLVTTVLYLLLAHWMAASAASQPRVGSAVAGALARGGSTGWLGGGSGSGGGGRGASDPALIAELAAQVAAHLRESGTLTGGGVS